MAKRQIRVGLIGYNFMGKAHSNAYRQAARFFDLKAEPVLKVICGRNEEAVAAAASKYGWESYETDYRRLLERDDVDLIDVSSPGNMHAPMAIAAAKAGKAVFCEKPLANTLDEAQAMLGAVKKAKVAHGLCHNYRRAPAVTLARRLIEDGTMGTIYHFRATYLQDWIMDPNFPLVWRLDKKTAGSGALGDLGAHIIDLARYLVGEITQVSALTETFIKERPTLTTVGEGLRAKGGQKKAKVTVDDCALFITRFNNGAVGSFEATRFAGGRKNFNRFEINGSGGSVAFDLERMNELEFYSMSDRKDAQGFRTILCNEAIHPYPAYWPSGHIIGYEHTFVNTVADLLNAIATGKSFKPDFEDGARNQAVLDAVEHAAKSRSWEKVPTIK